MPRKIGISNKKWLVGLIAALPIVGFLSFSCAFAYFAYDYQNEWEIQVESDNLVLTDVDLEERRSGDFS
ncbi:hypothetical protein [Costertonia aggregata]|uniref:Uncharacterized protein n=1 Tax=Costertonia aggregata TaxID=343403 RepID=A0A7H9AQS3_9FLAO|nr:hypothetical protein [Costertonia aggregata]QLG45757.1 hypothetical protein HYG79_10490 [Costertonia aggregata]